MGYIKGVATYLLVAFVSFFSVSQLWTHYRLRQILAAGSGVTLREYVAPSWRKLATRVRSGELKLTPEEQAERFDRAATFAESEARARDTTAASEIEGALILFRSALAVFVAQLILALFLGIRSVRKFRAQRVPPNTPLQPTATAPP